MPRGRLGKDAAAALCAASTQLWHITVDLHRLGVVEHWQPRQDALRRVFLSELHKGEGTYRSASPGLQALVDEVAAAFRRVPRGAHPDIDGALKKAGLLPVLPTPHAA